MPYRAQMGGIFGSGLYPKQQQQNNAGDIIDAVTRGATTLIAAAYARKQAQREQQRQDAQDKLAQRAADRQDRHDEWERTTHEDEAARKNRQEERADFEAGYTPAKTTTKDVVQPGKVESSGLFGAPGSVTAPSIQKQKLTIPSAYDFAASKTGKTKAMDLQTGEVRRQERMTDAKSMADYRESLRSKRPGGGRTTDSPVVHAAAQVRSQLGVTNTRIAKLEAERAKVAPGTYTDKDGKTVSVGGDPEAVKAIDTEIQTLTARRDSLSGVGDQIGDKLTTDAGITRAPTIRSAYAGNARKPNGSTIRGGGESSDAAARIPGAGPTSKQPTKGSSTVRIGRGETAPVKADGSTVRAPATEPANPVKKDGSTDRTKGAATKATISQAEATALRARGFTDEQLRKKYTIQ